MATMTTRTTTPLSTYADLDLVPKPVAEPGVAFVARDHLSIVGAKAIEGAPDLILEILFPAIKRRDLRTKRALTQRFGGREYEIVEPKTRTATVDALIAARSAPLLLAYGLIRSTVIPGPEVAVVVLFSGL